MTTQTLDAVFEHGAFRPLKPPVGPLREGQQVRLVVEADSTPAEILAFAKGVYAGLEANEISEIEQISLQRRDFLGGSA